MPDMFNLIRQAQMMKDKMAQFQKELEAQTFTASAGNGAVTVTVNGKHDVLNVSIKPDADAQKLGEWVKEAINEAGHEVNAKLKAEVGKMTGGLGLPGMF